MIAEFLYGFHHALVAFKMWKRSPKDKLNRKWFWKILNDGEICSFCGESPIEWIDTYCNQCWEEILEEWAKEEERIYQEILENEANHPAPC